jgi:uncharacterized protein YegP (UPF0339 family)
VAAKLVLTKGSTGNYRFNLAATNGQVIATSESYESKASALKGIESVKRNAPTLRSTTRPRANRAEQPGSVSPDSPAATATKAAGASTPLPLPLSCVRTGSSLYEWRRRHGGASLPRHLQH